MKNLSLLLIAVASTLGACGDSGVSSSKKIADLTPAEAISVCEDVAAEFPKRTVTCSASVTVSVGQDNAECTTKTDEALPAKTCDITVGEVRACSSAMGALTDAQLCSDGALPAACTKLFACSGT